MGNENSTCGCYDGSNESKDESGAFAKPKVN